MAFNEREWVNDVAATAITGVIQGAVMAMFVPDPPLRDAMLAGGVVGLVTGLLMLPIKVWLDQRPGAASEQQSKEENDGA